MIQREKLKAKERENELLDPTKLEQKKFQAETTKINVTADQKENLILHTEVNDSEEEDLEPEVQIQITQAVDNVITFPSDLESKRKEATTDSAQTAREN